MRKCISANKLFSHFHKSQSSIPLLIYYKNKLVIFQGISFWYFKKSFVFASNTCQLLGTPGSEPPPASAPPPPRHSGYAAPAPAAAYANAAVYPAYAPSGTGAAGPPPPVAVPATSYPGAAIAAPTAYNQPPPTYQYAGHWKITTANVIS